MVNGWTRLIKAPHWMEAQSIASHLMAQGIRVYLPERSSSGSLLGEPDLRLWGYSAVTEGFDIFVDKIQLSEAQKAYKDWAVDYQVANKESLASSKYQEVDFLLNRFALSSFFTLFVPLVLNVLSVYYYIIYIKNNGTFLNFKVFFGIVCNAFSLGGHAYLLQKWLENIL